MTAVHISSLSIFEGEKLTIDLNELLTKDGWKGTIFIATPNNKYSQIAKQLENKLKSLSNAHNLDLEVLVWGMNQEESFVKERWSLGWDDGNGLFVYLFPAEFFKPNPEKSWDALVNMIKYDLL